jgi:hypothetical protein
VHRRAWLLDSASHWPELLTTDPDVLFQFHTPPDSLRSKEFGTGSTQPREYN